MTSVEKLQQKIDLALIVNPIDIFYLTGERLSKGKLFVHRTGMTLFVDGRYIEKCSQNVFFTTQLDTPENIEKFLSSISFERVSLDGETLPHRQFRALSDLFPGKKILDESPLKEVRMIKQVSEIKRLKKSAELNYRGFLHLKSLLKVGMSENEAAWLFEKYCRENGATQMAFSPIVAFGVHTSLPHHRPTDARLKQGDAILVDIGVVVEGYMSDLTRSFSLHPTKEYQKMENLVKAAYHEAVKLCKPGVKVSALDEAARAVFRENGVEGNFKHSLGHSLGLEIHEYPLITYKDQKTALEENMVITIEPGLYFDHEWGYRHENMLLVTQNGYRNFYPEV